MATARISLTCAPSRPIQLVCAAPILSGRVLCSVQNAASTTPKSYKLKPQPSAGRLTASRLLASPPLSSARSQRRQTSPAVARFGSKGASTKVERLVVPPDFRIPAVLLGAAGLLLAADNKLAAAPIGLLGVLLAFQTTRVRFLLDTDSLEVVIGDSAEKSGENVFVGGENRWRYDTFTNWEFWWPQFPVLVYFKETQTKPEGQIHFFPVIADGKKLYDTMVERCGPSQNSGPK